MPKSSERSTTPPAFDPIQYAKDSDARIKTQVPRSETRLVTRNLAVSAVDDETWARTVVGAPVIVVSARELRTLPLDHRAGFLLSLMDGTLDLATVVEVSAMPRADAIRAVRHLLEAGVIAFRQT